MTYAQRCIQTYQAPWGSFILDRIYFTHTSKYSYITIWVCTSHIYTPYVVVEVVRWRTCGGSKKKHHKTKTSQKLQTSNDMDSLCKNDWLTLIHFSLRRSGDSNLTFHTGREMGGMTQEITHGCTSKVWSALTLRFPFSASAAFFHNWLELFERDGTLAFASRKRSQKFQPC